MEPLLRIKMRYSAPTDDATVFLNDIENDVINQISDYHLEAILKKSLSKLRTYIDTNRKRPVRRHTESNATSQLYNLFNTIKNTAFVSKLEDNKAILGLFDKEELDKRAPYWYKINYGGKIVVKNSRQVVPGYWGSKGGSSIPLGATSSRSSTPFMGGEAFHYTGKVAGSHPMMQLQQATIAPMYYLEALTRYFLDEVNLFSQKIIDKVSKATKKVKPVLPVKEVVSTYRVPKGPTAADLFLWE